VESSCDFGIEPSGSIKCWETKRFSSMSFIKKTNIEVIAYIEFLAISAIFAMRSV
jgi:hypothetical protein